MNLFESRRHLWRFALTGLLATTGFAVARAADEVTIVTPPVTPGQSVTVQSEPGTQVTVSKDAAGVTHIRHEAVVAPKYVEIAPTVVPVEPPAPREEVVRVESKPSGDYVWVPGYWRWDTDRSTYEWVPGAWRHQIPNMVWHPGRWEKTDKGYVWMAGFWGAAEAKDTELVVVKNAPPTPKDEPKPASPGADFVWVPGHWDYEAGEYQWVAGRWERPISKDMVYVPGEWARRGDGYVYIAGHWDYPEENRAYVAEREDKDEHKP